MACPRGHQVDIANPATVGYFDAVGEEGETKRFY